MLRNTSPDNWPLISQTVDKRDYQYEQTDDPISTITYFCSLASSFLVLEEVLKMELWVYMTDYGDTVNAQLQEMQMVRDKIFALEQNQHAMKQR